MRHWLALVFVVGCGALPLIGDDNDGAAMDAANGIDSPQDDSTAPSNDATSDGVSANDAGVDVDATTIQDVFVPPDAYLGPPDAAPVFDLDATTSPWAFTLGTGGAFYGVATDQNANAAIGGYIVPYNDAYYVQRVSGSGVSQWVQQVNGTVYEENYSVSDVAIDTNGNVYVAASVASAIPFGDGSTLGPGAVIVKYDASGNFQWAAGAFPTTIFTRIRTKSNGDVVAVGLFTSSEDFGGGTMTSAGASDAVAVELDSQKGFVRANQWGGQGDQAITALAIDWADRIIVAGEFEGTIDFGGGALTGPTPGQSVHDAFIALLASDMSYLNQVDGMMKSTNTYLRALTTDWMGNIFITGGLADGSLSLGGNTMTSNGQDDVIIAKYDSALHHKWSEHFGDSSDQDGTAIVTAPTGDVIVAGIFEGDLDFGLGAMSGPQSNDDIFVARFDTSGAINANYSTGNGGMSLSGIAYAAWPDVVIVGSCTGSVTFPSNTISCSYNGGPFAARLAP
jgi:hypothetical protein